MRAEALVICITCASTSVAQIDSSLFKSAGPDSTSRGQLNMDAIYNRPFLTFDKAPVSLGGYVEAKVEHLGTDGVSDGTAFAFQRMTLFVASTIKPRLRFLSEIELEEGGREIAIEFAALDLELDPLFSLRGGVVMNPIGAFNQNHDGPKWEFNDRPMSAQRMLPATWSNVGFGAVGKHGSGAWTLGYEVYLTNGFDASIISNDENRTFLPAAKENPERFSESFNGVPLFTGKVAVRHQRFGEIGLSTMNGVYNKFEEDGLALDERRRVDVLAIDANSTIKPWGTRFTGEWAWVLVDVPETYTQQYGSRQQGGYLDIVQPMLRGRILGFDGAVLNVACRLEYVDWNDGRFRETGGRIGDEVRAVVPAISFRPAPETVIRLNYRHLRQTDLLGNPPSITGGFQFGVSSYF
ncbi:MAG: hypothetical protein IPK70_09805 [Flavobacteriales bacterium]|jgi:hypothetical protein|nr:hypothetical protein [Flavobacteriales bacterium]